jgi:hypothetical protein
MLELKEDSFVAAAMANEHLQTMMNVLQSENNPSKGKWREQVMLDVASQQCREVELCQQ